MRRSTAIAELTSGLDLGTAARTDGTKCRPTFSAESYPFTVLRLAPGTLHARGASNWGSRAGLLRGTSGPSLAGGSLGVKDRRSGVERDSGFMGSGVGRVPGRSGLGWVDPDFRGARRRLWEAAREALRVCGMGRGEHGGRRGHALLGEAVVHIMGRQQSQAAVMMFDVVPGEEDVAVGAGVLDRAEPRRESRPVLQRLELRLRERVVVGDVRAGMGLRDPQV